MRVVNNSGDIDISSLTGPIQLNDQFGNINASRLDGSIRLGNNSGDINVSGATGDTRLQDAFGNINVTGLAAASVVAADNSGDITLRFATVPRQVNVTDSFGNVTLILPVGSTAYQVHTHNSFGSTIRVRAAQPDRHACHPGEQQLRGHHDHHPERPGRAAGPAAAGRAAHRPGIDQFLEHVLACAGAHPVVR